MKQADVVENSIMEKVSPIGFNVGDGKSVDDLVGEAEGMRLGDIVRLWLESQTFPMECEAAWVELVQVFLERDMTEDEALELLKQRGLERPTPEDALRGAVFYPNKLEGLQIVFLHEPYNLEWFGKATRVVLGFEYDLAGCGFLGYDIDKPDTLREGKVLLARCPAHKS